jgi:hypothetical protein
VTGSLHTDFLPIEAYVKYAESMSHDDDDLRQELFLAAWTTMNNGHTYPARVLHSMAMARIKYRRGKGKSIDNGDPWRRPKWGTLTPFVYDDGGITDPGIVAHCRSTDTPEDIALFQISYERFENALTPLERRYVDMKTAGFEVNDRALGISRYMVTRVRNGIRQKFFDLVEGAE